MALLLEMSIEPIDHSAEIVGWIGGSRKRWTMAAARNAKDGELDTCRFEAFAHQLRLLEGYGVVGVTMKEAYRGIVGSDEVDGRGIPILAALD
jgi:hypothetical protein